MGGQPTSLTSLSLTHVYYNPDDPLSYLGAWLALLPQGLIIVYLTLVWSTREAEVALAFAGQIACEAVNFALKRLIKEQRPLHRHTALGMPVVSTDADSDDASAYHHMPFRRGYGMPSSHAQFAGYWALTIALFLLVRFRGARPPTSAREAREAREAGETRRAGWSLLERVAASAAAFAVAVLIAWSRVYLHYHTGKQVLVGFSAGLVFAVVWFVATDLVRRCGLLQWALDLPPAQWLRIRDLAAEEDAAQAGWEKWQLRRAAQAAAKKK